MLLCVKVGVLCFGLFETAGRREILSCWTNCLSIEYGQCEYSTQSHPSAEPPLIPLTQCLMSITPSSFPNSPLAPSTLLISPHQPCSVLVPFPVFYRVEMWLYGLLCLSDRCQGHSISDISTLSSPHKRTHTTQREQPNAAWCVVNRSVAGDSPGRWSVSEISLPGLSLAHPRRMNTHIWMSAELL